MGTAVWKGLVRFGLISIPVKLYRAAKAEKISFRQLHKASGARVRHKLCTDVEHDVPMPAADITAEVDISAAKLKPNTRADAVAPCSRRACSASTEAPGCNQRLRIREGSLSGSQPGGPRAD